MTLKCLFVITIVCFILAKANCQVDLCQSNNCQNGGSCILIQNNQTICVCLPKYTGPKCEITNVPVPCNELIDICKNNGTCHPENTTLGFRCECTNGYSGLFCENFVQKCSSTNQCLNGGTCLASGLCICRPTHTGSFCENFIGCKSGFNELRCLNGGQCLSDGTCLCKNQYQGTYCQTFFGGCLSTPCKNNGLCQSNGTCACLNGYIGLFCENNLTELVDYCQKYRPCGENRCEFNLNTLNYVCHCPNGIISLNRNCTISNCSKECKNGGTCVYNQLNNPECLCKLNYYGEFCQNQIIQPTSPCVIGNPCLNGGQCIETLNTPPNNFFCNCSQYYYGTLCERYNPPTYIETCITNSTICNGNGLCVEYPFRNCLCYYGYTGRYCEETLQIAISNRTSNIIECEDNYSVKTCKINGVIKRDSFCELYRPCEISQFSKCIDLPFLLNTSATHFCLCENGTIGYPNCHRKITDLTRKKMPFPKFPKFESSEELFSGEKSDLELPKPECNDKNKEIEYTNYCTKYNPCDGNQTACIDLPYSIKNATLVPYLCLCGTNSTIGYPTCLRSVNTLLFNYTGNLNEEFNGGFDKDQFKFMEIIMEKWLSMKIRKSFRKFLKELIK